MVAAIGLVALLARPPLAAQEPPTASSADDVSRSLQSEKDLERELDDAIAVLERALSDAQRLGLERNQADALSGIGEALNRKAQYAAARERALSALAIYERLSAEEGIARASVLLSIAADLSGDYDEAKSRATRAMAASEAAGDRRDRALAAVQLARAAGREGADRMPLLEQALADARASGDRAVEARVLHSLGDALFAASSYEKALETLEQGAAISREIHDRLALGTVYNSIGRLYREHGRIDEALRFQLKALELHRASGSHFELMQSLNAVAVTYDALGNPTAARTYFVRALELAERSSSARIQDFLRSNLANTQIAGGDYATAARVLEGVLSRGLDRYTARRLIALSDAYSGLGRRDDALAIAEKAVSLCEGDAVRNQECLSSLDGLYSLDRRAAAHAARGDLDAALADVKMALQHLETARGRLIPADFFKLQFTSAQESIYSRAIALQLTGGRRAEALETAERARARAFVDLLASKDLKPRSTPQSDRRADATGAPPIAGPPLVFRGEATATSRSPGTSAEASDLQSEAAASAASTTDLVAAARRLQSTLLAYWVARDSIFIWVIDAGGDVHTARVDTRSSRLLELVRATSPFTGDETPAPREGEGRTIATRGAASIGLRSARPDAWRELYKLLVRPVRDALPRTPGALLTIVPHGPLSALAFAALQDERGRYLLEDYTLHYVPAGAVFPFTAARRLADAREGRMLVVADPVPPTRSKLDAPLPRLAGARAEAGAIARLTRPARMTALEGHAASESAVRSAAGGKAVLHFATHAIVRDDDPFGSFLALTSGPDKADDGLLTAREIYGFDLAADLVVLSACRSAGGRVTGDGISAFARAFIYAGTASLVASLWDVADEPTNRLLPDFYRGWFSGQSKARALRAAQLRLLRELRAGRVRVTTPIGAVSLPEHPVFWAGFALFGEPD